MQAMRAYAPGPFGQLHYRICGEGPALILCHQSYTSSIQFEEAYGLLAKAGFCAIGLDIPGFGMSDTPNTPPTIAEYAETLPALMDHLDIEQAYVLGHHSGACLVTEAALKWPDRFAKVIQNGPVNLTPEEQQQFIDTAVAREKAWGRQR